MDYGTNKRVECITFGNITTLLANNVDMLRYKISEYNLSLSKLFNLRVYGTTLTNPELFYSLVGFCNKQPVYRPLLISNFTTRNTLLVADFMEYGEVDYYLIDGHYYLDFGDLVYGNGKEAKVLGCNKDNLIFQLGNVDSDTIPAFPLNSLNGVNGLNGLSGDLISIWAPEREDNKEERQLKFGSTSVPYKSNRRSAVKVYNYTFTSAIESHTLNIGGKVKSNSTNVTEQIGQAFDNVKLAIMPFNLTFNECYRLLIKINNSDNEKLVWEEIGKRWPKDKQPLVELLVVDEPTPIAISATCYEDYVDVNSDNSL